jgi:hypothetical protein
MALPAQLQTICRILGYRLEGGGHPASPGLTTRQKILAVEANILQSSNWKRMEPGVTWMRRLTVLDILACGFVSASYIGRASGLELRAVAHLSLMGLAAGAAVRSGLVLWAAAAHNWYSSHILEIPGVSAKDYKLHHVGILTYLFVLQCLGIGCQMRALLRTPTQYTGLFSDGLLASSVGTVASIFYCCSMPISTSAKESWKRSEAQLTNFDRPRLDQLYPGLRKWFDATTIGALRRAIDSFSDCTWLFSRPANLYEALTEWRKHAVPFEIPEPIYNLGS